MNILYSYNITLITNENSSYNTKTVVFDIYRMKRSNKKSMTPRKTKQNNETITITVKSYS